MSAKEGYKGFRPLADMASGVLDPVLRKRAGINLALLQSWEDIIGSALGTQSRPLKILWPRRAHEDDPFQPATLVIACEGFAAIRIQHETGEIISRVNGFLGFAAIGRIKIEQKPVPIAASRRRVGQAVVDAASEKHIEAVTAEIEDDDLRAALARLGRSVIAEKAKRQS
ncbi:DUF721 domain-containing protein [Phyllobacterium phragmitis]|uniref:DUF721 domain-containing protein n=1 Tax=Phyllobacterium phragmitis TaxID=2670329 RepID=A0A2S9IYY2_9HYPH|nr:DUF721 domain-containing protein [Phyllobacterium phragmitis]PRD45737.1 DUF721 domain-containing protein [Phyllobacterium phragmitis]